MCTNTEDLNSGAEGRDSPTPKIDRADKAEANAVEGIRITVPHHKPGRDGLEDAGKCCGEAANTPGRNAGAPKTDEDEPQRSTPHPRYTKGNETGVVKSAPKADADIDRQRGTSTNVTGDTGARTDEDTLY